MYLCYVALGRKMATVGRLFGRDRTTAAYACAKMEDRRDDRAFDARIARLEELIADPAEEAAQFVEADRAAG